MILFLQLVGLLNSSLIKFDFFYGSNKTGRYSFRETIINVMRIINSSEVRIRSSYLFLATVGSVMNDMSCY